MVDADLILAGHDRKEEIMAGHQVPQVPEIMPEYRHEQIRSAASAGIPDHIRRALDMAGAPAWIPVDVGDTLYGKIIGIRAAHISNQYGEQTYPLLTVETETGMYALHCLGTVLQSNLYSLRPKVGDPIAVAYLGEVQPIGGQKYKNMAIVTGATFDEKPDVDIWQMFTVSIPTSDTRIEPETRKPRAVKDEPGF
jgi:hypothetical protein